MANLDRLLAVLSRINPAVWDAIIPHGPVQAHAVTARRLSPGAAVALNPQPLPPKEALLLESAAVARDIAFAAVSAEAAGNDAAGRPPARAGDHWGGTHPRPRPGRGSGGGRGGGARNARGPRGRAAPPRRGPGAP